MAHRQFTNDEIEKALRDTKGMVSVAAKKIGMARGAMYARIQKSTVLQEAITDEREAMTDTAELALHRAIVNGEAWAVCFYLKTMGKSRGYVEKQEISGPNGGPIVIEALDYRHAIAALAPPVAAPALPAA